MRLLSTLSNGDSFPKTKHYIGIPPELTGGVDTRQEMGTALFLVIQEEPDGITLYRYGAQGTCVGDIWHRNVDEAKEQATYEFGGLAQEWIEVPEEVADEVAFGLNRVKLI